MLMLIEWNDPVAGKKDLINYPPAKKKYPPQNHQNLHIRCL